MMATKIVYDENDQPIEAIIPYETYKDIEHVISDLNPDEARLQPVEWRTMKKELEKIWEITDQMGSINLTQAVIDEREESR